MTEQTTGQRGATHTPGDWIACPGNKDGKRHIRIETRGEENGLEPVATLTGPDREANAALIAAAPDLLAALEALFEHCAMVHKHWGDGCNRDQAAAAEKAARAAIAKATAR